MGKFGRARTARREESTSVRQPSHYQQNDDEYLQSRQTATTATLDKVKEEKEDKIDLTGRQDA
jgi:hypothetical protein